jgi:hypothetical protein
VQLRKLAVYGSHGLTTLQTGDPLEPNGLYLSDILKNIAQRFCPMLDTSGVQTNNYVVQHAAYRDRTTPYDAFLDLNKYALWHLGVWDNRQLVYRPYDLTDYDWEIRTDDPGTTFSPQGPSTDSLFNGVEVTYTDPLTGVTDTITPETHPELADTSSTNPWNTHGINAWKPITLSTPALLAQAVLLGQAALADQNRPKTPGTITVKGYVRDRAGNPQPGGRSGPGTRSPSRTSRTTSPAYRRVELGRRAEADQSRHRLPIRNARRIPRPARERAAGRRKRLSDAERTADDRLLIDRRPATVLVAEGL